MRICGAGDVCEDQGANAVGILTKIGLVGEGTAGAGFLAFYAFIGFEDMVNVAEEVKEPQRNLPRAILLSLVEL